MTPTLQIPSIILPFPWVAITDTETVNDLVEHTSMEFDVSYLHEKQVHITAIEVVVAAGVPGNLLCWIELSPFLTATDPNYWAAIGGGGGVLPPTTPLIEVATAVNGTRHGILLPWIIFSHFARLVVQVPVAATPLTDHWIVQAEVSGQGP